MKNLANASAALAIKLRIERHIDAAPLDPVAIHPTLRQPVLEGGGEERSQAPLTTRLSRVGQIRPMEFIESHIFEKQVDGC